MPQEQTEAVLKRVLEKLAEIEHVRWSQWQNYLHSFLIWNEEQNGWVLPHEKKEQWQRQLSTPYSMLSEKEKESDRAEVMKYMPILLQELSTALQQKEKEMLSKVGFMRQWLNEDRITDGKKMVTNEDIVYWLTLKINK